LWDLFEKAHTPWEWHEELFNYAGKIGITIFSSPFDRSAVEFLAQFNPPAYKIASPELVDVALIRAVVSENKPVILSTGASSLGDIDRAVKEVERLGAKSNLILLHCIAHYPATHMEANLLTIPALASRYDVPVGYSDHVIDWKASVAAISHGACLVERHIRNSNNTTGLDAAFSSNINEFRKMVTEINNAYDMRGQPRSEPWPSELGVQKSRRSLYVVQPVTKGERFTVDNVRSIRPANGLAPHYLDHILKLNAKRNIEPGTPLTPDLISGGSLDG
jgi:N-acetylneuraminate synthase